MFLIVSDSVDVLINSKVKGVYHLVKVIYYPAKTACFEPFYLFRFNLCSGVKGYALLKTIITTKKVTCAHWVSKQLNSPVIIIIGIILIILLTEADFQKVVKLLECWCQV